MGTDDVDSKAMTIDYEQTLAYFHTLHEVRFKLLGFLPVATGTAIIALPHNVPKMAQLVLACFGALVTIGLASYDQRNTQIYDRLVLRVRLLEKKLGFIPFSGEKYGGAFHCRPPLKKVLGMRLVWHIQGLTIVYAASLTGWSFLGVSALTDSKMVILLLTVAIFVASYAVLRIVSATHHRDTRHLDEEVERELKG